MDYIEIRRSEDFGHVDKEEKLYCHYLYYIAAPRARLIKNLLRPHSVPRKRKRVRLKTRGRFSTLKLYKDYILTLGVKTPKLRHVPGVWLLHPCLLVLYSVCSSSNYFRDNVRAKPW